MPSSYEYSPDTNTLHSYYHGQVKIFDVCQCFKAIECDPQVQSAYIEIVHFTDDTDFIFSSQQAEEIVTSYNAMKEAKQIRATIFIGSTPLKYGIARMMKSLHEMNCIEDDVRIVRSEEEAHNEVQSIRAND